MPRLPDRYRSISLHTSSVERKNSTNRTRRDLYALRLRHMQAPCVRL